MVAKAELNNSAIFSVGFLNQSGSKDVPRAIGKLILVYLSTFISSISMADQTPPPAITIFTHGEAQVAFLDQDQHLNGPTVTLTHCISERAGLDIHWEIAPLSRASSLINSNLLAMWTPATKSINQKRGTEFIGPTYTADILWYQIKDDSRDPSSDDFKNTALVTGYRGSSLIKRLEEEGYNIDIASSDHRHLLERLLYRRVDAILAVDFRHLMGPALLDRFHNEVKTQLYGQIDVGFSVSKGLSKNAPKLVQQFRNGLNKCKDAMR